MSFAFVASKIVRTRVVVTCVAFPLLALACVEARVLTWEDVPPTSSPRPAARSLSGADEERTSAPAASAGIVVDRALQAFLSARAASRRVSKTSGMWAETWDDVLEGVAAGCALPPRRGDLGAFVRARVTLEVELHNDRQRGVILPAQLERRLQHVLVAVDESVGALRAASAPGTLLPSARLNAGGELVLRAPVAPIIVSSPFGRRSDPFTGALRFHAGTDIDAPHGTTVYASAGGLVVYAGLQGGYGKHVIIDHGAGVRTHYAHLSAILVEVGQLVAEADPLGAVGSTGRSTGPHLHFAVTNAEGAFLDPVALLDVPFSSLAGQVRTSMRAVSLRGR